MNLIEKAILDRFKMLLRKQVKVHKIILFGSRARGDSDQYSDMDVVVILEDSSDSRDFDYVSNCAWEAGFESGIVVVPVVYTKQEWYNSPERSSLLVQAVELEGVTL
jgi:DNA polymerase sigma